MCSTFAKLFPINATSHRSTVLKTIRLGSIFYRIMCSYVLHAAPAVCVKDIRLSRLHGTSRLVGLVTMANSTLNRSSLEKLLKEQKRLLSQICSSCVLQSKWETTNPITYTRIINSSSRYTTRRAATVAEV